MTCKPQVVERTIANVNRVICFESWVSKGARYDRWQELARLDGDEAIVVAYVTSFAAGGGTYVVEGAEYTLLCDGQPVCTIATTPGVTKELRFPVPLAAIAAGWHIMDVVPAGVESAVPMPMWRAGAAEPDWMPVWRGGYEVAVNSQPSRIDWVPAEFQPVVRPLAARAYMPFSNARSRSLLSLEQLVPARNGYIHRPAIGVDNVLCTANRQWYTTSDLTRATPHQPLLDGPRGQGCIGFTTHLQVGVGTQTADPNSAPRNNVYAAHPWGVVRISNSGHITTLFGLRHPGIASYWEDPSNVELVGDFSGADNKPPHEIWGFAWDSATLAVDTAAAPIPSEDDRQPHIVGPAMVCTDPQNNRLLRAVFSPVTHGPAVVSAFGPALHDPWDVVEWRNSWVVSERQAHRIVQISKTTGLVERVVVQGEPLATVSSSRLVTRGGTLAQLRAAPCVLPEGLAVMDDWLYFAGVAQADVRRVHLETGELQIVVPNIGASQRFFLKVAVSDGTFGPRHTVFVTDWTVTNFGFPRAFLPGGAAWSITSYSSSGAVPRGPGGVWESFGYSGAVGVGAGRLLFGGAGEGVMELRATPAGEPAINKPLHKAGYDRWHAEGWHLTHGPGGWGYYGLPLPWGHSPETDYYLTVHGHAQG